MERGQTKEIRWAERQVHVCSPSMFQTDPRSRVAPLRKFASVPPGPVSTAGCCYHRAVLTLSRRLELLTLKVCHSPWRALDAHSQCRIPPEPIFLEIPHLLCCGNTLPAKNHPSSCHLDTTRDEPLWTYDEARRSRSRFSFSVQTMS